MKVLIVDDDRIALEMLSQQLSSLDYEVTAVADGEEAWRLFQDDDFSIVITDWEMPGVDGIELLTRIRGRASHYVYCILLTIKWQVDSIVKGMEAGADDFLTKPFDPNELRVRMAAGQRIIDLERRLSDSNRKMKKELMSAASIQRALLPSNLPDIEGGSFAWTYRPCDELGGDILNIIPLSVDEVAVYLLDVSGHGVSAALLSVALSRILTTATNASSAIRDTIGPNAGDYQIVEPSDVLARLNERFIGDEDQGADEGRYFTMLYGVLNLRSLEFRYASGGHPPAVLRKSDGAIEMLSSTGTIVGSFEDAIYEQAAVQLEPGSRMFVYSDGLTEAQNGNDEEYGLDRVVECIRATGQQSVHAMVEKVMEGMHNWAQKLDDDVSCLAFETLRAKDS